MPFSGCYRLALPQLRLATGITRLIALAPCRCLRRQSLSAYRAALSVGGLVGANQGGANPLCPRAQFFLWQESPADGGFHCHCLLDWAERLAHHRVMFAGQRANNAAYFKFEQKHCHAARADLRSVNNLVEVYAFVVRLQQLHYSAFLLA